jgi:hypothetical protein
VQVRGRIAADGSMAANSVALRNAGSATESTLKGNISAYDAASHAFLVRDVAVDARRAGVEGCPASGLTDGLYVEVEGAVKGTGVLASSVHCEDEPSGATIEREGVAGSVDAGARSFTLRLEGGAGAGAVVGRDLLRPRQRLDARRPGGAGPGRVRRRRAGGAPDPGF